MGTLYEGGCVDCGQSFTFRDGGGFRFELLRCDTCHRDSSVGRYQRPPVHARIGQRLLALVGREPASLARRTRGEWVARVEATHAGCVCGGTFRFDAPPRCPVCRSASVEKRRILTLYD